MSAEIGKRSDFSTVGSSRMVDTGLVAPATKPSGGKSITAPTRQGPPHLSTIRESTSSTKPNETDGMSALLAFTTNLSLRFQAMQDQSCHLCNIYTLPLNRHVVVSTCPCSFEVSWNLSAS